MQSQWQIPPLCEIPQWFLEAIQKYAPQAKDNYAAQLLWRRGVRDSQQLAGFLNPDSYQPSSPFEFGEEMKWALQRLQKARESQEQVTIWGDFDADGITATSVLWEGLGQFFTPQLQLNYHIPNRLKESHGLNCLGIQQLAIAGTKLIVTCDTGSTNLEEIAYAKQLGIDIIVTDHHTLPATRPPVIAILNPRYFSLNHPLYHLSGVAVAYKLVEAMYVILPDVPQQSVTELLDLVAIGLIADLVNLSGDCRYLAQRGIAKLQQQANANTVTRPGVARLLQLCQRSGDRPTDISFGLGPRINAVSRIHGDASFCVELLTSKDPKHTQHLAMETELANTRRKELQKNVTAQVKKKLEYIDLSTTSVIVLEDNQWQGGVLGLVAGQIAQEYGRPTILLNVETSNSRLKSTEIQNFGIVSPQLPNSPTPNQSPVIEKNQNEIMARGSARSVGNIDLYQLVNSQAHLLHRFGGHPFAAGLSLPAKNIPLFREAINQQLRQQQEVSLTPVIEADLVVMVADLGKDLFRELKLLEPCGMGNPVPKILIQNCWFTEVKNYNIKDFRRRKVQYIKTLFHICDDSLSKGFPGVWWGHYKEDIPSNQPCDAIVELDYNTISRGYEIRLIALRPQDENISYVTSQLGELLVDWRSQDKESTTDNLILLQQCPWSWDEIHRGVQSAIASARKLALAYPEPDRIAPEEVLANLVGIAKYLNRTQKKVKLVQLEEKLGISNPTLHLGLKVLNALGFSVNQDGDMLRISSLEAASTTPEEIIAQFIATVSEEQFLKQYFYQVPLPTVERCLIS